MKSKLYLNSNFERFEDVEFHSIKDLMIITSNGDNVRIS